MSQIASLNLADMQKASDTRGIPIDQVGVCDLAYPVVVLDKENQRQQVAAIISMSVNLPHHFKGTHMSRFLEVLAHHQGEMTMRTLPELLHELKQRLDAEAAHIEVEFSYFLQRTAPVSGLKAPMDYRCTFVSIGLSRTNRAYGEIIAVGYYRRRRKVLADSVLGRN